MKKRFKSFLSEAKPDWMRVADPSELPPEEQRRARQVWSDKPTTQEIRAKAEEQRQKLSRGHEQGPAINDLKVVSERLPKIAHQLDTLAIELEHDTENVGDVIRDLDELTQQVDELGKLAEKIWRHLAVGGKPYER